MAAGITCNVKCIVIGNSAVGKTSFLIMATTNAFLSEYCPTVFDKFVGDAQLPDGRQVNITYSDTNGSVDYDRSRPLSYPDADVFLVCFAVNWYASFENVSRKWIPEMTRYCPNTPWLLVGMLSDMRTNNEARRRDHMVEKDEAIQLAKDLGAVGYYECSTLEGTGLDDIVQALALAGLDHPTKERRKKYTWPWRRCLSFLYTGCADVEKGFFCSSDTIAAAKLLDLPGLSAMCEIEYNEGPVRIEFRVQKQVTDHKNEVMKELFLNKTLYSDITFVVDRHKIPAHRCVLTTRCEIKLAMFSGQFAESSTAEVKIPGVNLKSFMAFLQYLYTDHCPIDEGDATMILALANQYYVDRLKALCEQYISKTLEKASEEESIDKLDFNVIDLLLHAQLHNSHQLSGFLLHFVAINFQTFEKRKKEFRKLTGENLSYVQEHRWPPLSYINAMEEWKEKYAQEDKHCIVM